MKAFFDGKYIEAIKWLTEYILLNALRYFLITKITNQSKWLIKTLVLDFSHLSHFTWSNFFVYTFGFWNPYNYWVFIHALVHSFILHLTGKDRLVLVLFCRDFLSLKTKKNIFLFSLSYLGKLKPKHTSKHEYQKSIYIFAGYYQMQKSYKRFSV